MLRARASLIEAIVDVKTTGVYQLRLFVLAFARRSQDQVKTNCYAQIRSIRKQMGDMREMGIGIARGGGRLAATSSAPGAPPDPRALARAADLGFLLISGFQFVVMTPAFGAVQTALSSTRT